MERARRRENSRGTCTGFERGKLPTHDYACPKVSRRESSKRYSVELGQEIVALINGGGHPMAAGFTVAGESEGALREFLVERIASECGPDGLQPSLRIDGALQVGGATVELALALEQLALLANQPSSVPSQASASSYKPHSC